MWTVAQTTTSQAEAKTTVVTTSGQQAVRTFTVDAATFNTVESPSATTESSSSSDSGGSSTLDLGSAFSALSSTDTSTADTFSTSASATITARTTSVNTLSSTSTTSSTPGVTALAATGPNKIVLENQKQGNPQSEWGITGDGDPSIQGFATQISTNVGGTVDFKIATDSTDYRIEIYRLGYYGGDGARKVATIDKNLTTAQVQPHPIVDYTTGLIDCSNWSVSASWQIPEDATSGVYIAKLVREDGTGGASQIPFIVRDDASTSDIVFQTSDTTWQAYNAWGGASLYTGDIPVDPNDMIGWVPPNCHCSLYAIGKATAVSYNRPFITQTSPVGGTWDYIFGPEFAAIQWLEQNGYDVSYISGVNSTRNGAQLLNHDAFLSVGHDEYWSAEQRANVENARDSGVNLAFWSGNEVYWKVRWETDASGNAYRTMVCYKETWGLGDDPSGVSTGTWRDPRYADPGQEPENSLTGQLFTVDSYRSDTITIPYEMSNFRFWRDTSVADLQPGQTYSLVQNLLGYEWDSDVENGYRPAGMINMSLSTVSVNSYLRDYGTQIGTNTVQHSLTMYRAESGALVFGAGTVFWSWGLNDDHAGVPTPTDPNVQQAMVNMFADMGIQPMTLQASLTLATQSTDFIKPTSTITSPIIGASFVEGQKVTITGTASDTGGGIVAGVEVSLDGGHSWWKATGRENWTYNWVVQASGNYTIMSRAADDSLNLETPSAGKTVTVTLPTTSSLWTLAATPQQETVLDKDSVELGVKFKSSTSGEVTGIRFFKGFYNIGEHTVSLWTADGQLLARGVSTGESLDGWQQVTFSSPVTIAANTSYIASYHTNGYYSASNGTFTSGYSNGPLSVEANGAVYVYGNSPTFPTLSPFAQFTGDNYWVDVVFKPNTTNTAPVANNDSGYSTTQGNALTLAFAALTANDTDANGDALSITGVSDAVNGTVAINAQNGTVVFTPTAGYTGAASFKYTISDGRGGTSTATVSLAVNAVPTGVSLFAPGTSPTGSAYSDSSVELGMRFVTSASGTISGMKFYKAAGETGTHTGSIWKADGTLLGTLTFTNETASGWQTAAFSSAINIVAGEQYIVSYHSNGRYYGTSNYFTTAVTNGPLTAPASAGGAANGVYAYGGTSSFPNQTYQAANYWVDVLFNQSAAANTPPVATNDTGYTTTYNTAFSVGAAALLANDTDADGDVLSITGVDQPVNGTVSYNTTTKTVTFTPTTGYSGAASFRYTVSDGKGGTATATVSLTVNTPVNTAPTATNDGGYTTTTNTALTLAASTLLANDNDPDGDVLSITGADQAVNGTVAYNTTTKAVTFTPTTGYTGAASFRYTISDGRGGTSSATVSFSVAAPAQTVSLLNNGTPSQPSVNDPSGVELGMRFTVSAAGTITGIKYYKGVNDTGTHTGSLWTSGGTLLTTGTFTNETTSGWQTLTFSQPVSVAAGTTLVVSYHSNGNYAVTPNYFTSTITNGPLSATGGNNGVYAYGNSSLFPTNTYQASNYWVDVTFQNAAGNAAPVANNDTGFSTSFNTAKVIQASQLLANDTDSNGDTLNITGVSNPVNGTVAYNSTTKAVTFTPTAGYSGSASFSYSISDGNGGTSSASVSLTVNPNTVAPTQSVFASSYTPTMTNVVDGPVQLGMKFQTDAAGWITGFSFYKGSSETGTHTANLWTASGTLLGSATFTNETASGWQYVELAQQVAVTADTTYVVSYNANSAYSATPNYFSTDRESQNLTALSSAVSGGNGVYTYGTGALFPTSTYNSTSYNVDVAFRPQLAA
ncbi:MAG: DUF4082 domain-containing protein [Mesorhizobium sp.]